MPRRPAALALALLLHAGCGSGAGAPPPDPCLGVTCSGHGTCAPSGGRGVCACEAGYQRIELVQCLLEVRPSIDRCTLLPADHLFNTPIDDLPVHPSSAAYVAAIGATTRVHLDLGMQTDQAQPDFYGIPYNVVHGASLSWPGVNYGSADSTLDWDPLRESDCAGGGATGSHPVISPCLAASAPSPRLPMPAAPLVEGGLETDPAQPYGDHHVLILDVDACRLWELFHVYPRAAGGWDIFGSATWDLATSDLRRAGWTSADAAGFPILPLLLRADEASTGAIRHALRFTIPPAAIRNSYTWPARHLVGSRTSTSLPQMGQLFRLKAGYAIPPAFNTQARAIAQAMKTYGMYVSDGGSAWFVQGDPDAGWSQDTIDQLRQVTGDQFEAVDLAPIRARAGWRADSARVPPP